jgi:hypothetical protein
MMEVIRVFETSVVTRTRRRNIKETAFFKVTAVTTTDLTYSRILLRILTSLAGIQDNRRSYYLSLRNRCVLRESSVSHDMSHSEQSNTLTHYVGLVHCLHCSSDADTNDNTKLWDCRLFPDLFYSSIWNCSFTVACYPHACTLKNYVFWDVMPSSSCENRLFGGTYRLHYQGEKTRRAWKDVGSNYEPKHAAKK